MYYEEKIIDGVWYCRTNPNDPWEIKPIQCAMETGQVYKNDQKWRSPTGHPIASHETDKLPPKGEQKNDFQAALSILNSGAVINVEQEWDDTRVLIIPIGKGVSKDRGWKLLDTIKCALAQQQPDAELRLYVNRLMGYHPDYKGEIKRHPCLYTRVSIEQRIGLETIKYLNYRAEQKEGA